MNNLSYRRINTLTPNLKPTAKKFLMQANDAMREFDEPWCRYTVEITEAKRSLDYQIWLYLKGRKFDRSKKRWVSKMDGKIVTHTITGSNHLSGEAFDVSLWNPKTNTYIWPNPRDRNPAKAKNALKLWHKLRDIGEDIGLKSGARWNHPDYPHFEL